MMSLRTMIREMRSRPHRVIQDDDSAPNSGQRSWNDMPEELLREVILRIETQERVWPKRRSVVACAGVCSSWRRVTKEIVKTPELSGIITFPLNLKQPGPRECLVQCFIQRNRSNQTYHLYLSLSNALVQSGKYLFSARRCRRGTRTDYVISLKSESMLKKSETFIGKLRANFFGSKFTILDAQPPHTEAKVTKSSSTLTGLTQSSSKVSAGSNPVGHISYDLNMLGSRGPRKMRCVFDTIPHSAIEPGGAAPTPTAFPIKQVDRSPSLRITRSKSTHMDTSQESLKDGALVLKSKPPRWHEQLQCWCLNFHGRVTVASVKNFQLVASKPEHEASPSTSEDQEQIIVQFGKVGKDLFTMDYRYPLSAFQAFAVCLSSFASNVSCE